MRLISREFLRSLRSHALLVLRQDQEAVRPKRALALLLPGGACALRPRRCVALPARSGRSRHEPAAEIARAVLEACRAWSESDLADDCAVVVIKRTA